MVRITKEPMALEILDVVGERLNTMSIGESCMTSHTSLIASAKRQLGTVCAGVVAVVAVAFPTVVFEAACSGTNPGLYCSSTIQERKKTFSGRTSGQLFVRRCQLLPARIQSIFFGQDEQDKDTVC